MTTIHYERDKNGKWWIVSDQHKTRVNDSDAIILECGYQEAFKTKEENK